MYGKYVNIVSTDHLCCTSMLIYIVQNNGTEENDFRRSVLSSEELRRCETFFKSLTLVAAQFHLFLSSKKVNQ